MWKQKRYRIEKLCNSKECFFFIQERYFPLPFCWDYVYGYYNTLEEARKRIEELEAKRIKEPKYYY